MVFITVDKFDTKHRSTTTESERCEHNPKVNLNHDPTVVERDLDKVVVIYYKDTKPNPSINWLALTFLSKFKKI